MFRVGPVGRWPRLNNLLAWLGAVAVVLVILWVALVHSAMRLLAANAPMAKADWIVVLGGESGERVIGAAELYHRGVAQKIFVTGAGDCLLNSHRLEMAGVPAANILHECWSRTTYQNAVYTRQALTQFNPAKIILVTSWFHTRRALSVFEEVWPDVQFGTAGVVPGGTSYYWLPFHESGVVTLEYVKSLWYGFRYSPLVKSIRG